MKKHHSKHHEKVVHHLEKAHHHLEKMHHEMGKHSEKKPAKKREYHEKAHKEAGHRKRMIYR